MWIEEVRLQSEIRELLAPPELEDQAEDARALVDEPLLFVAAKVIQQTRDSNTTKNCASPRDRIPRFLAPKQRTARTL